MLETKKRKFSIDFNVILVLFFGTSTPVTNLLTDKGDYTFYGFGPSVFMSSCGLRISECFGLMWEDID